jgi:hypothetical protein
MERYARKSRIDVARARQRFKAKCQAYPIGDNGKPGCIRLAI